MEGFCQQDSLPQPELSVLIVLAWWMLYLITLSTASIKHKTLSDFGIVLFSFLLQVGESTIKVTKRRTRTQQFHLMDVLFMKNGTILDSTSPLEILLEADAVTLMLSNQKNEI